MLPKIGLGIRFSKTSSITISVLFCRLLPFNRGIFMKWKKLGAAYMKLLLILESLLFSSDWNPVIEIPPA